MGNFPHRSAWNTCYLTSHIHLKAGDQHLLLYLLRSNVYGWLLYKKIITWASKDILLLCYVIILRYCFVFIQLAHSTTNRSLTLKYINFFWSCWVNDCSCIYFILSLPETTSSFQQMNKSRFAENQLTRMCQAVLSSQKTACILRTSLVLTIFMEQGEEYLITLQFFFLMINRNTILFTQFLCSILMHWILPCINICSPAVPTDDTTHSWARGIMIKTAFFRGVLWEYALKNKQATKKPQTTVSAVASNYWFCCWYQFACWHGTHPQTDGILTTQKDRSMWTKLIFQAGAGLERWAENKAPSSISSP